MIQGTRLHPFNMARKGKCRICRTYGPLDPHHIISQGHAKRTGQLDLITNKGNIVWICRNCHDQTTASKSYRKMNEEYKAKGKKTAKVAPKKKAKRGRCKAMTASDGLHVGHQCRNKKAADSDYCHVHNRKSKERDPRRRKSKGDKKAKIAYNRYRKGGRKGQR